MTRVGGDGGFVMEKGDREGEERQRWGEQGFRRENRVQGAEHTWYSTILSRYIQDYSRTTLGRG